MKVNSSCKLMKIAKSWAADMCNFRTQMPVPCQANIYMFVAMVTNFRCLYLRRHPHRLLCTNPIIYQTNRRFMSPTQSAGLPPKDDSVETLDLEDRNQFTKDNVPLTSSLHISRVENVRSWFILWENRRDIKMTLAIFVYLFLCMFFVSLANSYSDRIWNSPKGQQPPAPDIILDSTREWYYSTELPLIFSDYLVYPALFVAIVRILCMKRKSFRALRRCMYIVGSAYMLRAFCIFVTVLPNPWTRCVSKPYDNFLLDALAILSRSRYSCGDVFFSGHTIMFVMEAIVFLYYPVIPYGRWYSYIIPVFVTLFSTFGMISLIFSTLHYTIDVIVGFVVVVQAWVLLWCACEFQDIQCGTKIGRLIARVDDPFWPQTIENWKSRLHPPLDDVTVDPAIQGKTKDEIPMQTFFSNGREDQSDLPENSRNKK